MKTIYSMGKGKFVTLDSYGVFHKMRRGNVMVAALAVIIASLTFGAMFGIDVTSPSTPLTPHDTHRTGR